MTSAVDRLNAMRANIGEHSQVADLSDVDRSNLSRQQCARWLDDRMESGWTAADRAEYLAALPDEMKDPARAELARSFWRIKCEELDAIKNLRPTAQHLTKAAQRVVT